MSYKHITLDRLKELILIDRLDIFYRSTDWRKLRKKLLKEIITNAKFVRKKEGI